MDYIHLEGNFANNEPSIMIALAKKFVKKTGGLLSSENFQYFRQQAPESFDSSHIHFERQTRSSKYSYNLSPALNNICQLICESPFVFQDQSNTATYLVEVPMMNLEQIHEFAQSIGMKHRFKYFGLEDLLNDKTNCEINPKLKNIFIKNTEFGQYVNKYVINQVNTEETNLYGLICCEVLLNSCMMHALQYPVFKKHGEIWKFYKAYENSYPTDEELSRMQGIIIPGSSCSAYSTNIDWYQGLFELIRKVYSKYTDVKLLGICFGAQIIAQALGGKVEKMPRGPVNGGEVLKINPSFFELSCVKEARIEASKQIVIAQAHGDHIAELPPGAVHHASSESANVEVFTVNDNILGFQGHPDYNESVIVKSYMKTKNISLNHKKYLELEEECKRLKFPIPLTQNETLKICFNFLKPNKYHKLLRSFIKLEIPGLMTFFNDQLLHL